MSWRCAARRVCQYYNFHHPQHAQSPQLRVLGPFCVCVHQPAFSLLSRSYSLQHGHGGSSNQHHRGDFHTLPKRIILMRHGESLGNVDENLYAEIPDWRIPLTRRGERQCEHAAKDLHELVKGETLLCYVSPYKRTSETWAVLKKHLDQQGDVQILGVQEEPRIAEQQFGNFQNPRKVRTAKAERRTFGRFFFRFPNGEAGLDVYNRVSSFLSTLTRHLSLLSEGNHADFQSLNVLIVTHGLTLRLLLMRYFQLSVEEFEHSFNAQNAKLVVLDRIESKNPDGTSTGRWFFRLDDAAKEALNLKGDISNEKPFFFRGELMDEMPEDNP
eukprot:Nitzschia sp. Nitz4//scaffold359_size15291//10770//11950//NITZ4_008886-RA/size15291-snap-gene-0.13-mRNA-1//-1//CDS//3329549027//9076//frame0